MIDMPNVRTVVFHFDDPKKIPNDLKKYLNTIDGNKLNGVRATVSAWGDLNAELKEAEEKYENLVFDCN